MVIDSSALLAIVLAEPDAQLFRDAILRADEMFIPASVLVEAGIVAEQRNAAAQLDALVEGLKAEIAPLDRTLAELARQAFRQFGRGFHKAALNFGDCMSYATARYLQLPLLYKGNDFRKTNIPSALPLAN
jgi:ribonuclease VapC